MYITSLHPLKLIHQNPFWEQRLNCGLEWRGSYLSNLTKKRWKGSSKIIIHSADWWWWWCWEKTRLNCPKLGVTIQVLMESEQGSDWISGWCIPNLVFCPSIKLIDWEIDTSGICSRTSHTREETKASHMKSHTHADWYAAWKILKKRMSKIEIQ